MFAFRTARRATISLVAVVAWLIAANYCTLAAAEEMLVKPATHACCSGENAPAKGANDSGLECCKIFPTVALPDTVSVHANVAFAHGLPINFAVDAEAASVASLQSVAIEWDTGPPRSDSFAESVLQRSLLAHAPPLVG